MVGQHGDAIFSVWRLAWIAHQVLADPRHLFDANIFFPEPRTLAYSDAILIPALVVAPLHWTGLPPVAIYNLTLLGAFVLNALAAQALVRRLTGSTAAAVLGGLVFAFAPFRFDHFDHIEMQFSFWTPLAVLAWHRAVSSQDRRPYLLAATFAACQVLSCIYYGIFLLTWLAAMTLGWFVKTPRRALSAMAWVLLLPMVVLAIYSVPYLRNRPALGDRGRSEVIGWSADASDFLSAPRSNLLYGWTEPLGVAERHLLPGLTAALFAVIGLWPLSDRVRLTHACGVLLGLLLALGFNAGVYPLLYEWVLPFRGLRVPARGAVLFLLSLSVLAGFGLARVLTLVPSGRRMLIAGAAVLVASVEYYSRPALRPVEEPASSWYPVLGKIPDAVVFEWPVSRPHRITEMRDVHYMHRSLLHWRPMLNGYSGNYPASYLRLLEEMGSFPDTSSIRYLQAAGATILVIHERPDSATPYDYAFERLARDPSVRVLAQDRDGQWKVAFFRLLPAGVAKAP